MGSDGIRVKDGKRLELDLLYNSDSVTEKTIAEYLQSEYLKLGITMKIHGEEEQSSLAAMPAYWVGLLLMCGKVTQLF